MLKPQNILLLLITLGTLITTSCLSNKKYVYLQDKGNVKTDTSGTMLTQSYQYKLQKGDILYISLSTDDERLNKIFVPSGGGGQMMQQGQGVVGTMFYYIGFTIDANGEVELPYAGKVSVGGKTIEEAKLALETSLKKFFKIFYLQVKVAEFKFSVLGYVNRPGQYFFQQNKVSIIEAISQAGDLQNLAKRFEVQLYRQTPEGVKLVSLDLTDRSLINSPYWYIQPNDVLYVQPLKVRTFGDLTNLQTSLAVITPIITTLLVVLNTYILVVNLK
ncbi:MAG: polysaccharide biosynthesis/export family protein [bacterium]|nr:polysaccharide biosynthesis/export family protein [bacterium]